MKKSLFIRFLLFFYALNACLVVFAGGVWFVADYARAAVIGGLGGTAGPGAGLFAALVNFFRSALLRLASAALPSFDAAGMLYVLLSLGLAAMAAWLFSRGIARDCGRLFGMIVRMEEGAYGKHAESRGAFRELEDGLGRLGEKLASEAAASAQAECGRNAACEDAMVLLAEARGRLEAVTEAGLVRGSGAEAEILSDVLEKIAKAGESVERARGGGQDR